MYLPGDGGGAEEARVGAPVCGGGRAWPVTDPSGGHWPPFLTCCDTHRFDGIEVEIGDLLGTSVLGEE
jgi:hypothetical protein